MDKKTEHELVVSLMKKIGPVDMDLVVGDVVTGGKHLIQLNGKRASDNEALALKKETEMILQTRFWKVVTETLRYQAQQQMFVKGTHGMDDIWAGRYLLHAISVLENTAVACLNPLLLSDQKAVIHSTSLDKKSILNNNKMK